MPRRPKQVEDEDDDQDDDPDEERSASSRRKRGKTEKPPTPMWRTVVTAAIAVVLLAVMGVVLWRALVKSGTLELGINVADAEVLIDGKKIKEQRTYTATVVLSAGNHDLKVTKSGYQPYTKQVTIKPEETENVSVVLKPDAVGPEELFRRMEQRVLKCKTLRMQVKVDFGQDLPGSESGKLLVAQTNKVRVALSGTIRGVDGQCHLTSNGLQLDFFGFGGFGGVGVDCGRPVPKQLAQNILGAVTRSSVDQACLEIAERDPNGPPSEFDLDKHFQVSDFKASKEAVADAGATQAVDYTLRIQNGQPMNATVWVNVNANVPVKRMLKGAKIFGKNVTITETYSQPVFDAVIADTEFPVIPVMK